jgi:glycosyltransferase involved in cell wall biosynthesis
LLRIRGRKEGQVTSALKSLADDLEAAAVLADRLGSKRVEWLDEYKNSTVAEAVFQKCDVLVVPSIWDENSPLVIHEALQCRVPIITAAHGGMGEFVKNGVNGLTFKHRDASDLARALQQAVADPQALVALGQRGYLKSATGEVLSSTAESRIITQHYKNLVISTTPSSYF